MNFTLNNIDIESQRLKLVRLSKKHVTSEYVSWINDSETNMYLETRGNYSLDLLSSYIDEKYKNEVFIWAIHRKDSNVHIGNIKIDPIDTKKKTGEYGILIGDKKSWGKGFAKEATIRILKYCFYKLNLRKITLGVIEENLKAISLYKNIGFTIDKINKDVGVYNNKLCNAVRMSIHINDFKQ
tara:strand:+ start:81 stop:629 length:549 start_codon:yes stop_codon:yes gene_type:complete